MHICGSLFFSAPTTNSAASPKWNERPSETSTKIALWVWVGNSSHRADERQPVSSNLNARAAGVGRRVAGREGLYRALIHGCILIAVGRERMRLTGRCRR